MLTVTGTAHTLSPPQALTIVALSICEGTSNFSYGNKRRTVFCGGVLILSMVVTPLLLLTYIKGTAKEIQKTPFEILVNFIQGVFMVAAGSIIINTYCTYPNQYSSFADSGKTAGSFCIINAALYLADTFFAYKNFS
nr:protein snakeskin-like [Cherax quadricarinatus]